MALKIKFLPLIATFALLSVGCKDDAKPAAPVESADVIVLNRGVTPGGVGSISIYDPLAREVEQNVFQKINTYNMGSLAQSVLVDGEITFVVVSGEGVVYILNTEDLTVIDKIQGMETPRYVVKATPSKYYISDWGISGVHVLNLKTRKLVREIETGAGPENMLIYEDRLFVVNSGGIKDGLLQSDSTVTVIQTETDTIMDTLYVGENPTSLQIDKNNKIWVLSPGITKIPVETSSHGFLHTIDADSIEVLDTLKFANNLLKPRYLKIDEAGENLYFLSDVAEADIYKHPVESMVLPIVSFIPGNFNCLEYDSGEERLYAGDRRNGNEPGVVRVFGIDGAEIDQFECGFFPINFGFKR